MQLLVGVRNDPQFGSIVVVGLGGTLVEVMQETSLRIGPVDADTAAVELVAGGEPDTTVGICAVVPMYGVTV